MMSDMHDIVHTNNRKNPEKDIFFTPFGSLSHPIIIIIVDNKKSQQQNKKSGMSPTISLANLTGWVGELVHPRAGSEQGVDSIHVSPGRGVHERGPSLL